MRIFWQSFLDPTTNSSYISHLSNYLNSISLPSVTVIVQGMTPPDREFGRLSELRCSIVAIDNGIEAENSGYDAFVMGHFQDPGLYELRSTLRIPVVGTGESTLLAASQLGRRLGLITLDEVFCNMHLEQAERYGIGSRIVGCLGMGSDPADFTAAFQGDEGARNRMVSDFEKIAKRLVDAGADVIVPAGVLPGLLLGGERGYRIGEIPVVNCAAIALKSAEMWFQIHQTTGLEPNRAASFSLASEEARKDFQNLVSRARFSET